MCLCRKSSVFFAGILMIESLLSLCSEPNPVCTEYIPITITDQITDIEFALRDVDSQSLVLWDIDDILLVNKDPYDRGFLTERIQADTIEALRLTKREIQGIKDLKERLSIVSRARMLKKSMLVHEKLPQIINELKKKQVPTIAVTNCRTGPFGCIRLMEDWRAQVLNELGINFSSTFAHLSGIAFEELCKGSRIPTFKNGIAFTGHACTKGELVSALLCTARVIPNIVVSIDDLEENLISEYVALRSMAVPCRLVRYVAGFKYPAYFNKKVAEFQLRYFAEHGIWLTGTQALACLEKRVKLPLIYCAQQ